MKAQTTVIVKPYSQFFLPCSIQPWLQAEEKDVKKAEPQQNLQSVDDRAKLDGGSYKISTCRIATILSQACTSASCAPAAPPLAPPTGGMETSEWESKKWLILDTT